MRVTFCGTGGAGLSAARAGASIHVAYGDDQGADQTGGGQLLLDCGPGWLERFLAAGLAPERLDAVLLSHLHFDHAMGLGELLTRWAFEGFALPAILGPRDIEDYAGQALAFARTQHRYLSGRQLARLDAARIERVTPGEAMELAGARLRSVTVPHAPYLECLSWRVESGGATLVYSGDTRPAPEVMASQAAGADVLIHEAFSETALVAHGAGMPEAAREGLLRAYHTTHSPVREVARIAAAAAAPRLVLTHLLPEEEPAALVAEAAAEYGGEVIVARDGLSLDV